MPKKKTKKPKKATKPKKTKKTIKKQQKPKKRLSNENTATPILPTTPHYIKSSYYYNRSKKILIERLDHKNYIFNINGKIGIVEKEDIKKYLGYDAQGFLIGEDLFIITEKYNLSPKKFYNTPSISKCEDFIKGKIKPRSFKKIYLDVKKDLAALFDFESEVDLEIAALMVAQSWIKPILDNFFFCGIDATKGGGKTTLGEIIYFLMRHGFVGGDVSPASVVRVADALDLNIFVDEIDQNKSDVDLMSIFRKGQRRNNPYLRCEGRNFRPVNYDVCGCHGFSFRSEVEDALASRSLCLHTAESPDNRLPLINSHKKEVLQHLADELFFWYISNFHDVVGCSEVAGCSGTFNHHNISRENIYNVLTSHLNSDEKTFLKGIFGRDNELSYLAIRTSKILGLDLLETLKSIMSKKKEDAASSETFYYQELQEYFIKNKEEIFVKKLTEGDYEGCYKFPKNKAYAGFVNHLRNLNIMSIGNKKFTSLLRDLGFVQGINLKSERFDNYPTPCLIFDKKILKKLNLQELDFARPKDFD